MAAEEPPASLLIEEIVRIYRLTDHCRVRVVDAGIVSDRRLAFDLLHAPETRGRRIRVQPGDRLTVALKRRHGGVGAVVSAALVKEIVAPL